MREGIDRASFRGLMQHVPGQMCIVAAGAGKSQWTYGKCSLLAADLPPIVRV